MRATYFDGRTARAHPVDLTFDGDAITVAGVGIERREPIGAVIVDEPLGSTMRLLHFVGGASCEVGDNAEFAALLARHGRTPGWVASSEQNWKIALVAVVVVALAALAAYRYGLPALARTAADRLPASALDALSVQMQRGLDNTFFAPTDVPIERMLALIGAVDRLTLPESTKQHLQINFRKASTIGANALALPSGAVFVTDELMGLTADDRVIVAVIAHEAGHVERRHGLRKIIQSSIAGVLITWYFGDISAVAAAAPAALINAKYSRDLEREADEYAVRVLKMNGMPPSLLAEALDLIEKSHGRQPFLRAPYLSSHPATAERLDWIRRQ